MARARPLVVGQLLGRHVRLEPLRADHAAALAAASSEDRSTYGFTEVPDGLADTERYVEQLLGDAAIGEVVPFVQIEQSSGRVVGCTRFMTIRRLPGVEVPYGVEVGGTWLASSAQRTRINTEAKRLLLGHAFEVWKVARVDLKTDARNERSRRAIERIGGHLDGVLRRWQPSLVAGEEGSYRDSAIYSIVPEEWPEVRRRLVARLEGG